MPLEGRGLVRLDPGAGAGHTEPHGLHGLPHHLVPVLDGVRGGGVPGHVLVSQL